MVPPLADPIGDRSSLVRHLKALAECLGEALQSRAGQTPIDSHPHPVEIDLPPWILARGSALRRWLFSHGSALRIEAPEALWQEQQGQALEMLALAQRR